MKIICIVRCGREQGKYIYSHDWENVRKRRSCGNQEQKEGVSVRLIESIDHIDTPALMAKAQV